MAITPKELNLQTARVIELLDEHMSDQPMEVQVAALRAAAANMESTAVANAMMAAQANAQRFWRRNG